MPLRETLVLFLGTATNASDITQNSKSLNFIKNEVLFLLQILPLAKPKNT
jgi:hypothetical protein